MKHLNTLILTFVFSLASYSLAFAQVTTSAPTDAPSTNQNVNTEYEKFVAQGRYSKVRSIDYFYSGDKSPRVSYPKKAPAVNVNNNSSNATKFAQIEQRRIRDNGKAFERNRFASLSNDGRKTISGY